MAFNQNDEDEVLSEINVTPFIDVMLVLLVIFMVTIPLATVNIPVNLPAATANPQKNEGKPLTLSLNEKSELYLENDLISMGELEAKLNLVTSGNKQTIIFFKIDKEVKYDLVMKLMNQLRVAGYLKVGLLGLNQIE